MQHDQHTIVTSYTIRYRIVRKDGAVLHVRCQCCNVPHTINAVTGNFKTGEW